MKLFIIASVLSVACAQYPYPASDALFKPNFSHESQNDQTRIVPSTTSWKGPIADHHIGVLPVDTPAVAAAKYDHIKAQQELLAVLPQLPAEELNRKDGLSESAILALQKLGHEELNRLNAAQISLAEASGIPPTRWTGPKADHQLGVLPVDTPAVAAAKADIAKAHKEILTVLPQLSAEELYRKDGLSESAVLALQKEGHDELNRLNAAQISLAQASGIPPTRWTGPKADHQLGVLPFDTPAVAAAKADIAKAYKEILTVLPQLSAEELYRKDGLSESAVLALQKEGHDELNRLNAAQISLAQASGIPPKRWTGPKADHQLGVLPVDTPAVAAAKADIAKAHQEILAVLPPLPAEESYVKQKLSLSEVISLQQQGHEALNRAQIALAASAASEIPTKRWTGPIADHQLGQHPKETREVAAAKADHLRAHQELLTRLPTLSAEKVHQQQGLFNNAQISLVASNAHTSSSGSHQGFSGISTSGWTGAIADHQLGVLPVDTPDVANAKADHLKAQREFLAKLPQLPADERYIQNGLSLQEVIALQQEGHNKLNQLNAAQIALAALEVPSQRWTGPVAHHQLGQLPQETAEVTAAKADHLKAYKELLAVLPTIREQYQNQGLSSSFVQNQAFNQVHAGISSFKSIASEPSISTQRWTGAIADHRIGELPAETPAVAAARAEHAEAQRALLAKLPVLSTDQRYIKTGLSLPAVLTLQKQGHDELNRAQIALASAEAASSAPIKPWTGPFATHQLGVHPGDTPEVAAAKADHLNAYQQALNVLPQEPATEVHSRLRLPYPNSNL